jgi:transposase InsO family protein
VARYRAQGSAGLRDRSSAPRRVHNRTDPQLVAVLCALRRLRFTAPELSDLLGMPVSTISAILMIHIDVKKLGRIHGGAGKRITGDQGTNPRPIRRDRAGVDRGTIGWDAVHVAIDDATRLAYVEVLGDEKASTAVAFLRRAIVFYARHGITVERVITDNGSPYISTVHAIACRALKVRHLRTRPYRPQTNGKAERFIRTILAGWAYGAIYRSSHERTQALDGWLWQHNHHRPHSAIGREPPITRLNNLLGTYS